MQHYRSSISEAARERVITRFRNRRKCEVECVLKGELVGRRYDETGDMEYDIPLKNGRRHGIEYRSDDPGALLSAEPYFNGLPHGTAREVVVGRPAYRDVHDEARDGYRSVVGGN